MSNTARNNVVIRNIYYMMAYAFRALDMGEYKRLDTEEFENLDDLLAAIIVIGINQQRRRGFERNYQEFEEDITGIRGRIDISKTARLSIQNPQQTHCSFDEFTEDTYKNRILKRTAEVLLTSEDVKQTRKTDLKRCLLFLRDVSFINEKRIEWNRLRYHRNNTSYQLLMNVCWMVLHDQLLTEDEGKTKLASFMSDRQLHALYEKFVLEYFRKHHPDIKASAKILDEEEDLPSFLPRLHTDITLENGGNTLIIDTKCYGEILKTHHESKILSPANLNQIYVYAMQEAHNYPKKNIEAMLLYALTKSEDAINTTWSKFDLDFHCRTLDLNQDFSNIQSQLNAIADIVR